MDQDMTLYGYVEAFGTLDDIDDIKKHLNSLG